MHRAGMVCCLAVMVAEGGSPMSSAMASHLHHLMPSQGSACHAVAHLHRIGPRQAHARPGQCWAAGAVAEALPCLLAGVEPHRIRVAATMACAHVMWYGHPHRACLTSSSSNRCTSMLNRKWSTATCEVIIAPLATMRMRMLTTPPHSCCCPQPPSDPHTELPNHSTFTLARG